MNSSFVNVYWFFIPLFIAYLTIPVLAQINKKEKNKIFLYIAGTSFLLNSLIPFINDIFNLEFSLPLKLVVGTDYVFYIIIGYLIDRNEMSKKQKNVLYFLAILGLLAHIIGTYFLSMNAGQIIRTYKGYTNVPCIFYSIGVFIFFKDISAKINNYKYINFLSKHTFSIYLMHYYIISVITTSFNLNITSIIYRLGMPFVVIPICIAFSSILKKIPIINCAVP